MATPTTLYQLLTPVLGDGDELTDFSSDGGIERMRWQFEGGASIDVTLNEFTGVYQIKMRSADGLDERIEWRSGDDVQQLISMATHWRDH